jgi:hypothetical protein
MPSHPGQRIGGKGMTNYPSECISIQTVSKISLPNIGCCMLPYRKSVYFFNFHSIYEAILLTAIVSHFQLLALMEPL